MAVLPSWQAYSYILYSLSSFSGNKDAGVILREHVQEKTSAYWPAFGAR